MKMTIEKMYQTTDFYLTAYLLSKGGLLRKTKRNSFGKLTFCFTAEKPLDSLVSDFYASKALVNPLDYQNQLRNLKSLIYATKNEYENGRNSSDRANIQCK